MNNQIDLLAELNLPAKYYVISDYNRVDKSKLPIETYPFKIHIEAIEDNLTNIVVILEFLGTTPFNGCQFFVYAYDKALDGKIVNFNDSTFLVRIVSSDSNGINWIFLELL